MIPNGHQEGEGYNFHYQNHGYRPLICYNGMTDDLLEIDTKAVHSPRYIAFQLCSSCPNNNEFYKTLKNIWGLQARWNEKYQ